MAVTCDAGAGCTITCEFGCIAIRDVDTGQCHRACVGAPPSGSPSGSLKVRGRVSKLRRNAVVSFSAKRVTLAHVGLFLSMVYPAPIAVPAKYVDRKVSSTTKKVVLSRLVRSLGLLV